MFMRHVPAAIAMFDRKMRYIAASQRWLADYALPSDSILGISHYEVFPEIPARWREIHARCLNGETLRSEEEPFLRADGKTDWVRWECVPWYETEGAIGGIMLFTEMVTERVEAQNALRLIRDDLERIVTERTGQLHKAKEAAERADEAKTRFLAAASHDLRQPLQSASSYLSVLEARLNSQEGCELGHKLRNSIEVMGDILNVLLDICRLQTGGIEPEISEFPIGPLLVSAVLDLEPAAHGKGLAIETSILPGFVRSDRALLGRIVENLVSNAIRYTPTGRIRIRCRPEGDDMLVEIEDSGVGMSPEVIERIFDEYFQVGNQERDPREGFGLGLAIVRHIAHLLGIAIGVRSTPGEGSTFSFAVPLAKFALPEVLPESILPQAAPGDGPTVLLVDDEPAIVDSTQLLLRIHGMTTVPARNATEAIAIVAGGLHPDVILTDFRLPDHNGLELIRHLRRQSARETPAIVLTGDTTGITREAAGLPACFILQKPADSRKLIQLIKRIASPGRPPCP